MVISLAHLHISDSFTGLVPVESTCAVSVIRAGDSLLDAVMKCEPKVSVGTSDRTVTHVQTRWHRELTNVLL
jgi:uracil phosphoribosyltransferase